MYWFVSAEGVKIIPTVLLYRIAGDPAAEGGGIPAVAVVVEAGVGVEELGGEAVAEEGGHRAGRSKEIAEGVVGIGGDDGTALVRVAEDVADLIAEGEIIGADARHGISRNQIKSTARTLHVFRREDCNKHYKCP